MARLAVCALGLTLSLLVAGATRAQAPDGAAVHIGYLTQVIKRAVPSTILDPPPRDEGVIGARLAAADNNTTGRFTKQHFELEEVVVPADGDVVAAFKGMIAKGSRLVVADLPAEAIAAISQLVEARDILILNAAAPDDILRGAQCRANLLHMLPSRAMLGDALGQYLVKKKWRNWFLVIGRTPGDQEFAAGIRRAAKRFGGKIVAEKNWTFAAGARRTDSGHYTIQSEIQLFTQVAAYDVLVVADESDEFGDYLMYRTFDARPVAGTHGLVPTAWARVHEQWGATQMQLRFRNTAKRWMTPRDYGAWVAVRAIGEAATRTASTDPSTIAEFIRGRDFELAAYKGTKLTVRDWDGQLRQPILLAGARSLVSASPQEGFLHQFSELDTLGFDKPESPCKRN